MRPDPPLPPSPAALLRPPQVPAVMLSFVVSRLVSVERRAAVEEFKAELEAAGGGKQLEALLALREQAAAAAGAEH